MAAGVVAGLFAGALWGLTFIAPLVAAPYTPFDLTVTRYLVFGLASLALLAPDGFAALRRLSRADILLLAALGFAGNVGYFLAMALAVPLAGSGPVALVIGTLPVVMAIFGNWRAAPADRVPPAQLAPALVLILAGLALAKGPGLLGSGAGDGAPLTGLGLTLIALALWSWYGLRNAAAVAARPGLSAAEWTALTGVGTLLALLPVVPVGLAAGLSAVPELGLAGPGALRLLLWGLVLGLLASWLATWAWSVAARRLPVALAGQLIVSETVFTLVYGWLLAERWPGAGELAGALFLVVGVLAALRAFGRGAGRTR